MIFRIAFVLALSFLAGGSAAATTVRIGVTGGPQAEILVLVKQLAAANRQIEIELLTFSEPSQINAELNRGKLDAASFEDGVAQAASLRKPGYPLATAAQTVTLPLGLYSKRIHHLNKLTQGATIVVPQDRHDQSRALLLLHNYGLIGLRDQAGTQAGLRDITRNPRKFRIQAVRRDKLIVQLEHADLVAIDYDTAAQNKLAPARDGLGMEDARSPYASVLTVRSADKDAPWLTELLRLYRSEPVKLFILTRYQDSVRRPW